MAKIASDEKTYWIGGGDYCRHINRKDRRHRESELANWLHGVDDLSGTQQRSVVERLEPIKDRCLGLCKGNHEDDILAYNERDVYGGMCNTLMAPERSVRLDVGGFVVIRWRCSDRVRWTMTVFAHHGHGGGLLEGGHALMLGRLSKWYEFDIALVGHRHVKHWVGNTRAYPNATATKFLKKQQHALLGGTYLDSVANERGEESYAERKLLPPSGVGVVKVRIRPGTQEIHSIM